MKKGNQIETKLIDFEGGQLLGIKTEDGKIYLGIRKACEDLGFTSGQARRQVENLKEDLVLSQGVANLRLPTNGGEQEVLVIHEDFVPLWFAKISLTPSMQNKQPNVVHKIISYQIKAAKVLHEAFMATEEQRQELFNEMGIRGEIIELKAELSGLKVEIQSLIDNQTLNSRQAQKLLFAAKDRVGVMLGGAHSEKYKKDSRMYFKNLWLDFCKKFEITTYKDLNPKNYSDGFTYINNWSMSVRG